MSNIIAFCTECKKVIDDDWKAHCDVSKDGMHWLRAFYDDEVPEEFKWILPRQRKLDV